MTTTPVERDVLAYSNCPVPNALLTALEAGLLAQEGIALEVLSGAQGALHFTYDHPAYTRFGGEIPPLVSEGLRAPGRTRLLGVTRFAGPQGFYVCADSPVRSPAELAGRRVGVSAAAIRILRRELGDYRQLDPWRQTLIALGTWEARGLLSTLERGGVKLGDVDLVAIETPGVDLPADRLSAATSVKGADLFPAVARRQAERPETLAQSTRCSSWLPWAAELEDLYGARVLADLSGDQRNLYASVWTVSAQLVETHPDLVQRLVDAAVRAGQWSRHHHDEVVTIHAANLGVAPAAIDRGFGPDFAEHLSATPGRIRHQPAGPDTAVPPRQRPDRSPGRS
ncbi:desulfurase [Mycobacterium sp. 20KCMC460]|uniref:2'-hydroxybiphenyl-2-sulfinate desulfinase n=1 Tax=Mycobacterium sp. 20KCMC460 TaxID=2903536 RepID=UPI00272ED853|nr:2'-hydroxybiphenyl-2-sulfinate desulfinase [Mycobacterium sp. 20KCMC460]BDE12952.1 desulfurase [Mycobacterium sp. 20KCMC460]